MCSSAAVRVHVEDQNRLYAGSQCSPCGDDDPVERAERRASLSPGVMQPARQRPCHSVRDSSQYRRDDSAIRCRHRTPHPRIPGEPLTFGQVPRFARAHRLYVRRVVNRSDLIELQRPRRADLYAIDGITRQRIRNPLRLPRRIERLGRRYIVIRIEDLDGIASLSVPPRIIPVTPETTFKEEVQKHCN